MEAPPNTRMTADGMTSLDGKDVQMAINGPVYFLIQEQAKSVASIQELQSRMAVLENLQERLMQAIEEVNRHLASETKRQKTPTIKSSTGSSYSEKRLRFLENGARSSKVLTKTELSKSDSYNKDSGIEASDSSLSQADDHKSLDEDDELLHLLDVIDQKSLVLLRQVEGVCKDPEKRSDPDMDANNARLLDNLLFEKVSVQRQLSEITAERDELKHRLAKLELATKAVTRQKIKVQQELDSTLLENQSLQDRINRSSDPDSKMESLGYLADIAKSNIRRKYLQYSEKSRLKVSGILKEANILELQKQLLTYVMENDILRAKLQHDEPSKLANWLKVESKLMKNIKETSLENQRLQDVIQTKSLEIASLKDKVRFLEEGPSDTDSCVKNFGMGSAEDWREPGVQNIYNKRSNLANESPFSPLGYGDFSKTQSLPVMLLQGAHAKLKVQETEQGHFNNVFNTDSFTDIPLHSGLQSGQNNYPLSPNAKNLVDLSSPIEHHFSSTSTLVQSNFGYQQGLQSGFSAPNLNSRLQQNNLQNWCFAVQRPKETSGSAKLVNGHLCWKETSKHSETRHQSDDISSICSEFDPLSGDSPSMENFVDSLNLSIPLKPIRTTQLSSTGNSLHSASLDMARTMGQNSGKVHNAVSVDGIRELLMAGDYSKGQKFGHTSVASLMRGKTGARFPMNLARVGSDYSIL